MSSGRALKVAEDAMRRGLMVYVETRPMYLHVTADVYQRSDVVVHIQRVTNFELHISIF